MRQGSVGAGVAEPVAKGDEQGDDDDDDDTNTNDEEEEKRDQNWGT